MSAAGGAMSAMSSMIGAGANLQAQEGWQQLTQQQQQFLRDQLAKIQGIQTPEFNTNLPSPEQLALGHYAAPQMAQGTQVQIDPNDRTQQMAALQKLQNVASGAADSELNAANYKAMSNAAQQEHSANAGIMANLASRGVLGSGGELAAKMQAAQNGANNSQAGQLEAAANNNRAKLGAQHDLIQGLSGLRGQDTGLATENANILNQFNMHNTDAKNQTNNANTNVGNQQAIYNTGNNNAYQQALLQLQNQAAQQTFQDKLGQAQAGAGEANVISQNAMSAGGTGLAIGANTASGIAQGLGNFGNAVSGGGGADSDPYSNVNGHDYTDAGESEKAPNANDNEDDDASGWGNGSRRGTGRE